MSATPLTQNEILILTALGAHESYGREITDEIDRITKGRYRISLGGLYTTLHRMEKKKLISGRWGDRRPEEPYAQRRYYRVTGLGERALRDSAETLTPAFRIIQQPGWGGA
jgi:PadR family transcriptional regulator, regulatory protein PadR